MRDDLPRLMNYKEAIKFFNIGTYNTLYKFIDNGLPVVTVGNTKRIDQKDAENFLRLKTESRGDV